jgi:hypothetical protein
MAERNNLQTGSGLPADYAGFANPDRDWRHQLRLNTPSQPPDLAYERLVEHHGARGVPRSDCANDEQIAGQIVHLARDISHRKRNEELLAKMLYVSQQLAAGAREVDGKAPVVPLSDQECRILRSCDAARSHLACSHVNPTEKLALK